MKRWLLALFALGALAPGCSQSANIRTLYDGLSGVSCPMVNHDAKIPWRRPGGDWVDADGLAYGPKPFATFQTGGAKVGQITVPLPAGLDISRLMIKKVAGQGWAKIDARESMDPTKRPYAVGADGMRYEATFDSAMYVGSGPTGCGTASTVGRDALIPLGQSVHGFSATDPTQSYSLSLNVSASSGALTTWGVYQLSVPESLQPPQDNDLGLSAQYQRDVGLCADPNVIYCETWDDNPDDWWKKTNGKFRKNLPSVWHTDGGRFPDAWPTAHLSSDNSILGDNLAMSYYPNTIAGSVGLHAAFQEVDDAYLRYYIRFQNFKNATMCDGGKFPGLQGDVRVCGNAGARADGYCGQSTRMGYGLTCDHNNPMWPRTMLGVYVYHAQQEGLYGDWFPINHFGDIGYLEEETWYCIEQHVKINTPGLPDGLIEVWVDNQLGFQKSNFIFRKIPDATHPYRVPGNLGIVEASVSIFHGGKRPMGVSANIWADQIVVAKKRIGCATGL